MERDIAEFAVALFAGGTVAATLQRIVDLAVVTIDGCDACGIFLVKDESIATQACSDALVADLDRLQLDTDEGPCLDAVSEAATFYAMDLAEDSRWPRFGPSATALGIRSLLAVPLAAERPSALNLYARLPAAFGATDRAKGLIFATLAGLALKCAAEREGDVDALANLHQALRTREMIGQAEGILMERERITAEQAFDVLRRASQNLNIKLREVADAVVVTGEVPTAADDRAPRPPPSGSGAGT